MYISELNPNKKGKIKKQLEKYFMNELGLKGKELRQELEIAMNGKMSDIDYLLES